MIIWYTVPILALIHILLCTEPASGQTEDPVPEQWAPVLLRESSHAPSGYSESPKITPWCQWTDFEQLECFVRTLNDGFGSVVTQGNWHLNTSVSVPTGVTARNSFRNRRKITSLRVFCHRLLLYQSILSAKTFKGLENLEELTIIHCKLSSIPQETLLSFRNLRRLTVASLNKEWAALSLELANNSLPESVEDVNLSHNNLWTLPKGMFCNKNSLIHLNLSNNHLQSIDELGFMTAPSDNDLRDENDRRISDSDVERRYIQYNSNVANSTNRFLSPKKESILGESPPESLINFCRTSLQSLALNFNDIVRLPSGSFRTLPELLILSIANNDIRIVSNEAFDRLYSLQVLDMTGNHIMQLRNGTFAQTKNLEKLLLANNSISDISSNLFNGLNKLLSLDLSRNKLSIDQGLENLFQDLRRLVLLDMSHNLISSITGSLFEDLTSLQRLDLSYNHLEFIPTDSFKGMFNLYELHLSHNKISSMSRFSFMGLVGLNYLNLDNNSLRNLHPTLLAQSSNLRSIILSNNKFEEIPEAVGNLPFVKIIDMSYNNILMIEPFNFTGLTNLDFLSLSSNFISNISQSTFHGLSSLSVLALADNSIEAIAEKSIDKISGLTSLNLSRNLIRDIDSLFAGMEHLEELNLAENSIQIFDYAFLPRRLLKLDLSRNEIKQLGNYYDVHDYLVLEIIDASFNSINMLSEISLPDTLKEVYLEQNVIETIQPGTFLNKTSIRIINLRMNQLSKLNPKAVGPKWEAEEQKEAKLLLGGNPLTCDCEMEWLYLASVPKDSSIDNLAPNYRIPLIGDVSDVVCTLLHNTNNRTTYTKVIDTHPEDYLCPYATHCFALCHCCDFIACDCRMNCPTGCSCYHDDTWSMNIVDCSRGILKKLPDKVPMDATVVYLDGNNINKLHAHHFIGRHSVQTLYLNHSNVQTLQNRTFHGLTSLQTLYLQGNMIVQLNGFEFSGLFQLKELHLQDNRISFLSNSTFVGLKTLEILHLENNFLVDFPVWMLAKNKFLRAVTISNNPWDCNCQFIEDLKNWVSVEHRIVANPEGLFCVVDDSGTIWHDIIRPDFTCAQNLKGVTPYHLSHQELPFLAGGLCAGIALVTGLIVISMLIIRRRAATANKLGFSASSSFCQEDEDGKVFDAYISHSSNDVSFVRDVIANRLENATPSYKLCLHSREFSDSGRISESISQSICFSKRIVIVLSKNYAEREWKNSNFRRSHLDNLKNKENSIITINFDGILESDLEWDLRLLVKKSNKIRWGDRNFWKRLIELLPQKSVYSAFSVYISDPLYKSPVPLLGLPTTMDLPSSSSVLTTTTGLPTPSDGGRSSIFQEFPTTYKSAPPPRPCNHSSSREYIYMSGRDCRSTTCHCHNHSHPTCYMGDSSSVHTYNSLEALTHQVSPSNNDPSNHPSSPDSHHYSVINPPPCINPRHFRHTIERKGHFSYELNLQNPLNVYEIHEDQSSNHYCSLNKNQQHTNSSDSDSQGSSSYASSGRVESLDEDQPSKREIERPLENSGHLPGLPTDECFV